MFLHPPVIKHEVPEYKVSAEWQRVKAGFDKYPKKYSNEGIDSTVRNSPSKPLPLPGVEIWDAIWSNREINGEVNVNPSVHKQILALYGLDNSE